MTVLNIQSHDRLVNQKNAATAKPSTPTVPFEQFFDEAVAVQEQTIKPQGLPITNPLHSLPLTEEAAILAQAINQDELEQIERRRRQNQGTTQEELSPDDLFLNEQQLDITPFQLFIDRSIEVLDNISQQEFRVNDLTEQYIAGNVSVDEVSIEATKLNMAITFATTVITTASQTFKDLTQMAV